MARNITLSLDDEILREARILAAQQGFSVSAFLRRELSRLVEEQRGFVKAREAALRRLAHGASLGAGRSLRATIFTTVPSFVDTNILVYAEDRDAGRKREIARDLAGWPVERREWRGERAGAAGALRDADA